MERIKTWQLQFFLMIANIIIDPNRPQKNKTLENEVSKQGIMARVWRAIPDSNSVKRSINLSHKQIVKYAKESRLAGVCILEEDVKFYGENGWRYFLENIPADYDIYLGGVYGPTPDTHTMRGAEKPAEFIVKEFSGFHCYLVNERFYDNYLSVPDNTHIDGLMKNLGKFVVCYPFAALQHPGWSSNCRKNTDYNKQIPLEDIYEGTR